MSITIDNVKYIKHKSERTFLYTTCMFVIQPHCSRYLLFNLNQVTSIEDKTCITIFPMFKYLNNLLSSPISCYENDILVLYVHNPYDTEIIIEPYVPAAYIQKCTISDVDV